jgi:hypothetical protein
MANVENVKELMELRKKATNPRKCYELVKNGDLNKNS